MRGKSSRHFSLFVLVLVFLLVGATHALAVTSFTQPIQSPYYRTPYVTAWKDVNWTAGQILDWKGGSHTYDQHGGTDYGAPTGSWAYPPHHAKVIDVVSNYVGNTYPNGPVVSGNRVVLDTLTYASDGHR